MQRLLSYADIYDSIHSSKLRTFEHESNKHLGRIAITSPQEMYTKDEFIGLCLLIQDNHGAELPIKIILDD